MNGSGRNCFREFDPCILLDYLEGRLEPSARQAVEDHVSTCPECAAELASLRTVDVMLRTTPGAFHPDAEELFLFAQSGKDPDGFVSAHLVSCKECSDEVEALKEMTSIGSALPEAKKDIPPAVMRELGRLYPRARFAGWLSAIWRYVTGFPHTGVRMPVLALGTAAAAVMVVVVSLQTWHSFKETAPQIETPRTLPAAPIQKVPPAEAPSDGRGETLVLGEMGRHKAKEKADRARPERDALSAPPVSSIEPKSGGEPELSYADKLGKGKSKEEPPEKTAPVRKRSELKQTLRSSAPSPAAEAPGGMRNEEYRHKESPAREAVSGKTAAGSADLRESKISVEVRILDEHDKPLPELKWRVPGRLAERYRVVHAPAAVEEPFSARRELYDGRFQAREVEKQRGAPRLIVTIQVRRAGEAYELEGSLFEAGPAGAAKKSIRAENVARTDLENRIGQVVSSLLSQD